MSVLLMDRERSYSATVSSSPTPAVPTNPLLITAFTPAIRSSFSMKPVMLGP